MKYYPRTGTATIMIFFPLTHKIETEYGETEEEEKKTQNTLDVCFLSDINLIILLVFLSFSIGGICFLI